MIGGVRVTNHLCVFKLNRPAREDPVQRPDDDMGPHLPIAKSAAISGLPEPWNHGRRADLGIEIACHNYGSLLRISFRIGQHFVELQ